MRTLVVVDKPELWPIDIPGVEVVAARNYLFSRAFSLLRGARVFNLCRSYRYQSTGYYVSLLAAARGHRPVPSVTTIQDLKASEIVRIRSQDLEALVQQSLSSIDGDELALSVYFGATRAPRLERLGARIFGLFEAPLLRASFRRDARGLFELASVRPIAADEIPADDATAVVDIARDFFRKRYRARTRKSQSRYDLGILFDAHEAEPPSTYKTIPRFIRAAESLGLRTEVIGRNAYARLGEFDALFIRETTSVNHHTYRFAQRAAAEGLVVYDDPESIMRCTNKVYLAELLARHGVPTPPTMVLHRGNLDDAPRALGLPMVLKQPDGAFSLGVKKVDDEASLRREAARLFMSSELILAQSFTPTELDWRVGVMSGRVLWVCRYFMARGHWQIRRNLASGRARYGRVEAVPLAEAPPAVLRTALAACRTVGDGLYGVDLKQVGRRVLVIEVNDNPTIEAGDEDAVAGDELSRYIMLAFLRRLDASHAPARSTRLEPLERLRA